VGTEILTVGQNRIYAPYMTVYTVISLPKIPYIHRIYMVLANPTDEHQGYTEFQAGEHVSKVGQNQKCLMLQLGMFRSRLAIIEDITFSRQGNT